MVEVQRRASQGLGAGQIQLGQAIQPQIALPGQTLAGLGLGIGRQQHADPGAPGGQQGDGQFAGIFQIQGQALDVARLEGTRQVQGLLAQGGVIQIGAYGATGVGVQQLPLKAQPGHASLLTRWRTSHSPANSRPIRP